LCVDELSYSSDMEGTNEPGKSDSKWRHTAVKAKIVGFFSRHIADKSTRREHLTKYVHV